MSQTQAKAARRKAANNGAHLGNSLKRRRYPGAKNRSVTESIMRARQAAAREAAMKIKKK